MSTADGSRGHDALLGDIFKAYDVRGTVPEQFDARIARAVGVAFAHFAGARRVLFLVDRGNLGRQTKKEFDQYVSPVNNYKFGEEFIVQHLTSNQLDRTARVCISTIQRMFSMLKGRELPEEADEESAERVESLFDKAPEPIDYNPAFPIETFDIIVTDEAHRSIHNLWRQDRKSTRLNSSHRT